MVTNGLKSRFAALEDEKGQTTIEYLMLVSVATAIAYLVITGPLAQFTSLTILTIRSTMANIVQNAELQPGLYRPGDKSHPSNPARLQPLH